MSLLEMSVSAALFILAATVVRALAIHKLPHKSFLFFWGIALFLLFVPLRIPSPVSLFSLLGGGQGAGAPAALPALTGQSSGGFGGFAPVSVTPATGAATAGSPAPSALSISPLGLAWLVGCLLCILFFLGTHLRCRHRYSMSLPCENDYVGRWLARHRLRRTIQVRVSDQISAPLTYGLLRPVVLLPKGLDWNNTKQLDYILTHEWTHIRRFDVAFKFVLVAAVCLHWFNPLVWVLFVLAGRDIELACDETVVRVTGIEQKRDYALALINLEERRSRFAPLCTSFSKNGVEERIKGIMKWKKVTIISVLAAVVLVAGIATVFATSAGANRDNAPPAAGGNTESVFRYALPGETGNHSGYTEENYAALMAMKTDGYREETLASFNERFKPLYLLYSGYNQRDENIEFLVTLGYSAAEITYDEYGDTPVESVSTAANHNMGGDLYYGAEMDYEVQWEVDDPANITVGRRDDLLNRCHVGVQGALDDKSREELDDPDILEQIQQECNALALLLSKDGVHITIAVRGVNSAADDADFVKRDYPQLLDLRIDGYEDMTVTEFREAVLNKMAKDEDTYLREIDRATRDNRFDRTRYSNADAAFVMNTLAPLTAERWQSWRYGGYFMEQAGMAEYQFTLTILDADSLTIREHTGVWQGMATAVGSALKNAPATLWQDEAGMENLLQTAADGILAAENRAVQVEMGYLSFLPEDNNDIIPDGTSTPPAGEVILDGATVKLYNEDPQYPYIHDIFTNNTNQTIIGWSSGMLAYDAQGNPLEVDWYEIDSSASSSYENIVEIEPNLASGYTIVPGDSYNVDGGWSIFGEVGPDGKTDVAFALFCFRDITFEDGTVWVNPAFDAWMAEHRGRQLDISYLESYYPATQSIA